MLVLAKAISGGGSSSTPTIIDIRFNILSLTPVNGDSAFATDTKQYYFGYGGLWYGVLLDEDYIADVIDSLLPLARWRVQDMTTVLNDGDAVASWTDRSGNDYHAVQNTADYKPTLQTNEINGKAVIRFDGTNDFLATTATNLLGGSSYTVFMVYRPASLSTLPQDIWSQYDGNVGRTILRVGNSGTKVSYFEGDGAGMVNGASDLSTATTYISTFTRNGTSINGTKGYINGSLDVTTTFVATPPNAVFRIGSYDGTGNFANGDMAEMLVFVPMLSVANQQAVEDALGVYYGITITH